MHEQQAWRHQARGAVSEHHTARSHATATSLESLDEDSLDALVACGVGWYDPPSAAPSAWAVLTAAAGVRVEPDGRGATRAADDADGSRPKEGARQDDGGRSEIAVPMSTGDGVATPDGEGPVPVARAFTLARSRHGC